MSRIVDITTKLRSLLAHAGQVRSLIGTLVRLGRTLQAAAHHADKLLTEVEQIWEADEVAVVDASE